MGRRIEEDRVIGSQTYPVHYSYDAAGHIVQVTYPSGRTIYFDRDANGNIDVIRNQPSGGSVAALVSAVTYTPFGPRSGLSFANGVSEARSYDQDGRIASLQATVNATSTDLINRIYAYADKRNLTGIVDTLDGANDETYFFRPTASCCRRAVPGARPRPS